LTGKAFARENSSFQRAITCENPQQFDHFILHRKGKIETILWAVGGFNFPGMDEKLVALPLRSLRMTDLGTAYNKTVQQLKNLPEFSCKKSRQSQGL